MAKKLYGVSVAVVLATILADGLVTGYSGKVLLVSMDGFRWDYIKKVSGLTNFERLAQSGVAADYASNTFVTKTFPCHYTIVTGLHAESHGIVANKMWDPERNAEFSTRSRDSFWWDGGEPIWVTAVKHKKRAATYLWPGSDSLIRDHRPTEYKLYERDRDVPFLDRVETVIQWFTDENMDFATLYFHEPDSTGHTYGPDSQEVVEKVREMDRVLGHLLDRMEATDLADVVNLILTSDHGMAAVDMETRLINLWETVTDHSMIERVVDSGLVTAIKPAAGREEQLVTTLKTMQHVTVYKKEEIPEDLHYKNNPRIMPVIVIADEGWTLSANVTADRARNTKGNHGYSNKLPSMRPIFFARGPDFAKGKKLTSVSHIDIYPLLCELLGITPAANNGSLDNTRPLLRSAAAVNMDPIAVIPCCILAMFHNFVTRI